MGWFLCVELGDPDPQTQASGEKLGAAGPEQPFLQSPGPHATQGTTPSSQGPESDLRPLLPLWVIYPGAAGRKEEGKEKREKLAHRTRRC